MLSLKDVTSHLELEKAKQEVAMLQKLQLTISKDLVDPLNLIFFCVKWLIQFQQKHKQDQKSKEFMEHLFNIMIASKMSIYKCKDLLELSVVAQPSQNMQQTLMKFRLSKATKEIAKIIELQSRGKRLKVVVTYAS